MACSSSVDSELEPYVEHKRKIMWVADESPRVRLPQLHGPQQIKGAHVALAGQDPTVLRRTLAAAHVDGLYVSFSADKLESASSVQQRLQTYAPVAGFRGEFIGHSTAIYVPDKSSKLDEERWSMLVTVARRILAGEAPPHLSSFPSDLRTSGAVEVMLLLRKHGQALFWRSTKGNSVALAFLSVVAATRDRWSQRSKFLGGPLAAALPQLDVELYVLRADGTLQSIDAAFLKQAVTTEHGVGLERGGQWFYVPPERVVIMGGAERALASLKRESGLRKGAPNIRYYRLTAERMAVSAGLQRGKTRSLDGVGVTPPIAP